MRESYLVWREKHVASGALLADIESDLERPMGRVRLVGRLDRTDSLTGGAKLILDYKTERPISVPHFLRFVIKFQRRSKSHYSL